MPWHGRLIAAYTESHRHYHNLRHLEECLTEFDAVRGLAKHPALVEVALWFHDAVYDPRSATNEEDSLQLAAECLAIAGVQPGAIETVRQLILSTKTHEPTSADAALVIDVDLAILGQPSGRFWEYEQAIKAEYRWVPAATFAEKRAEILARFLQRPAIYHTAPLRLKYEAAARANLQAAIAHLR
jgi:predicted metal-dependent HD superfamily phosphohydrolase